MGVLIKYGSGHELGLEIDLSDLPPVDEILKKMSRPVAGVHQRAKRFPPEQVGRVLRNKPFEDYPRAIYASQLACEAGSESKEKFYNSYFKALEDFLRRTFHSLTLL